MRPLLSVVVGIQFVLVAGCGSDESTVPSPVGTVTTSGTTSGPSPDPSYGARY